MYRRTILGTVVNTGSTSQCLQTYCVPCHSIAMCIGQSLVTIQLLVSWKSSHEVLSRNRICSFVSRSTLWIPEHQNGAMVSIPWIHFVSPWWGHDANFAPTHPMECAHTVVPVLWFYTVVQECAWKSDSQILPAVLQLPMASPNYSRDKIHANVLTVWLIQHVQANLKYNPSLLNLV